eukprot:TRINITY_DN3377_c0_g1_i1.p1 TRINITY_DN3377_c0_g1~~TRINITY_DN3377_c0_g1_i1.p1  ORF type:complete len:225 (-),score=70.61 TRINITY_DN3377_c0_g1_i1:26-700(-)
MEHGEEEMENGNSDVGEEGKRKEAMGNMEMIEKEFAVIKENFFAEKMEALDKEYEAIEQGTHQGFLRKLKELGELKEHRIWAAQMMKESQVKNIESAFSAERQQSEVDEFASELQELKEQMLENTIDKLKRVQDEKSNLTILTPNESATASAGSSKTLASKKKRPPPKDPALQSLSVKRKLNPPHIHYALKDAEILDDLNLIQKATANHPAYSRQPHLKNFFRD